VAAWITGMESWRLWALRLALMALAGTTCLRLLRGLGLGLWPSLVGACLFELNGTFAWFGQGIAIQVAALPLLLLGVEQAGARRMPLGLIFGSAMVMLCGHRLALAPAALLVLAWCAARLGANTRGWALAIGGGVMGMVATLPVLVAPTTLVAAAPLLPGDAALLLFPYVFGDPTAPIAVTGREAAIWRQGGGYLDLTWATLALTGLRRGGRLPWVRLGLGLFVAISLVCAAGLAPGLANPADLIPCWCLAAAVLAALALQDWRDGLVPKFRRTLVLLAPVLPLTLIPIYLNILMAVRDRRHGIAFPGVLIGPSISIALQLVFVVGISALIRHSPSRVRRAAVTALLLANALGLFIGPMVDALSAH